MIEQIRDFCREVRVNGFARASRAKLFLAREYRWERECDIDTLHYISTSNLGGDSLDCHRYSFTFWQDFRAAMQYVRVEDGKSVFVDYGSGMGRVLIMAATYPFRKVVGVEYSAELTKKANKNWMCALKKVACKECEIFQRDARSYRLADEVSHIYMYNPFSGDIMAQVITEIVRSLTACPREVWFILNNPSGEVEMRLSDALKMQLAGEVECFYGFRMRVYRASPALLV